jgi:hypothetical protein
MTRATTNRMKTMTMTIRAGIEPLQGLQRGAAH